MSQENDSFYGFLSGVVVAVVVASYTSYFDDNKEARYGKSYGLPENCRAYVQAAVDGYRNKTYTADEAMTGLERNCGAYGHTWKSNRSK